METLQAVVGKRDSEFTGLKGQLLRYVGSAFFCAVFGLLVAAAGDRHEMLAAVTGPLSDLMLACAISLYPVCTCWLRLARMTRAFRAGHDFELAGAVLALFGREGAERARSERGGILEGEDLVAAMRAGGSEAVLARFGREGAYRMCRDVYLVAIVVFAIAFIAMAVVSPF